MGFNLYDLWVSVVYVVGFCHIFGKKGKTFVQVMGFDQFLCSCYGFQTFVVLKGFNLLYRLWVLLYILWVQSICSTKKVRCICYDCNPLYGLQNHWERVPSLRFFAEKSYRPLKFGKIAKKSKNSSPGIEPGPPR